MDINNLGKKELEELLKKLKSYKDLRDKLWKRWIKLFNNKNNNTHSFEVEYSSSMDLEFVKQEALNLYKNIFKVEVKMEEIVFTKKESLLGWMKVYLDDKMIDLSFLKFYNKLKY